MRTGGRLGVWLTPPLLLFLSAVTGGSLVSAQEGPRDHPAVSDPARGAASRVCLGCHDGSLSRNVLALPSVPSASPARRAFCRLESPAFNHPIGVEYVSCQAQSRGRLKPLGSLLRLEEGKIGCLTCHDLSSSLPARLAMRNERSALCLACHDL